MNNHRVVFFSEDDDDNNDDDNDEEDVVSSDLYADKKQCVSDDLSVTDFLDLQETVP